MLANRADRSGPAEDFAKHHGHHHSAVSEKAGRRGSRPATLAVRPRAFYDPCHHPDNASDVVIVPDVRKIGEIP
jgi:hypothetical protein